MYNFQAEAVRLLSDLIQIDTTNPPGNELEAVRYLQSLALDHGLESQIFPTAPGRGNLVVRYPGRDHSLPAIILLSHLDVVPADPSAWEHPPFSGLVQDGMIWGRGAVDTKQLTVMEILVLLQLKQNGVAPARDIYLVATADEEQGSQHGLKALLEANGDLFRGADVISEGGGFPIRVGDATFYLCESGQKGPCSVRFCVPRQAHANPFFPSLAGIRASTAFLARLENFTWPGEIPQITQVLIDRLSNAAGIDTALPPEIRLARLLDQVTPTLHKVLSAMVKNTLAVTVWRGGRAWKSADYDNELFADVRLLPGVSRGELEKQLEELTEGLPVEWEILNFQAGYEANPDSALFRALSAAVTQRLPGVEVLPFLSAGASDGRYLQPYGARVYGFSPVLVEDMTFDQAVSMVHGVNERISINSLIFGTEVLYSAVLSRCQENV